MFIFGLDHNKRDNSWMYEETWIQREGWAPFIPKSCSVAHVAKMAQLLRIKLPR